MQPANRTPQPDTSAPLPKLLLTPEEAAEALSVHRATLYKLMDAGEIASIHIGRARRIPVSTLQAWIDSKLGEKGGSTDG